MPTNDLHRACGCDYKSWSGEGKPDWGRAGALLGLGEGADPHPDANRLCAEKDSIDEKLPLHLALGGNRDGQMAPEDVLLAIIDAHPQVRRHAESRRTKEFSPLGPRAAVSWSWVLAWGMLEPSRRGGENAQKTEKNGGKMGEIWSKTCEHRKGQDGSTGRDAGAQRDGREAVVAQQLRRAGDV